MGSGDENTHARPSKPTASTQETPTTPLYPNWSSPLQAYYGLGATTRPFFTSPVSSSPTPHPYLWGSQHVIPPYGTPLPYPALYPHGGLYAHPNMAMSQGAPPTAAEVEGNAPDGKDRTSTKKSNESLGNTGGKPRERGKAASGSENDGPSSSSAESGSDGTSAASDQNTNQQELTGKKKRSFDQMLADGANAQNANTAQYSGAAVESSFSAREQPATNVQVSVPGKSVVAIPATNLNIGMDLWNTSSGGVPMKTGSNASGVSPAVAPAPVVGREGFVAEHLWIQDERELKKQRRKQSNRESARRSRLRKQAECEELQSKVEALSNENNALKDELKRLAEECTKLTSENSSIMEELTRLYGPDVVANLETKFMKTVINSVHGGGGDVQDTSRGGGSVSCQKEGNFFYSSGKLDSGSNKHETILFYSTNL
ncbi:G-box-binding factor 1-like isoform X3 [Macadamia integrifolia]|uniref:G-box-binding factor 1-like isoform X3 n=1 Tax=Macadamia integrifolia TaxID=60698 RepID=UPI001C4E6375|nr:G-box-binding factor 1-like isoform X3 [Macadamia integrifolia]